MADKTNCLNFAAKSKKVYPRNAVLNGNLFFRRGLRGFHGLSL